MAMIVVEVDWPEPLTDEGLKDEESHLMECIGERGGRWLKTAVSLDRKRTVCFFEAPDAESMRDAYRRAGVTNARIWSADLIEPPNAAGT